MNLNLKRFLFEENTTLGLLYVNGVWECFTLEDIPRAEKIKKETAIPTGTYRIELTDQNKWAKLMPHIQNVPNFQGIYIHSGNSISDTEGCPLVGENIGNITTLRNSKFAFDRLMQKLRTAWDAKEDILISVENYIPPILE